ncbi:hypothetical protein HXX76_004122 [Chlamydomonas incerta]|uniref:Uncharacterized protein n=1 Tax=Chlamydomonas incerta TaxID=51695 RepID=A0A835W5C9_CHLIN|nr:hypothetical protein HXX76_004122 [Chlamydomonas incerta]|eukprot:KAG2440005.1 hypothetical protein HXX76_004122 [Chlamydomonas incerta]
MRFLQLPALTAALLLSTLAVDATLRTVRSRKLQLGLYLTAQSAVRGAELGYQAGLAVLEGGGGTSPADTQQWDVVSRPAPANQSATYWLMLKDRSATSSALSQRLCVTMRPESSPVLDTCDPANVFQRVTLSPGSTAANITTFTPTPTGWFERVILGDKALGQGSYGCLMVNSGYASGLPKAASASSGCQRPSGWCTADGSRYTGTIDCDGDGVLDHVCVDVWGRGVGVISSGSAPACNDTWPTAPRSACRAAFTAQRSTCCPRPPGWCNATGDTYVGNASCDGDGIPDHACYSRYGTFMGVIKGYNFWGCSDTWPYATVSSCQAVFYNIAFGQYSGYSEEDGGSGLTYDQRRAIIVGVVVGVWALVAGGLTAYLCHRHRRMLQAMRGGEMPGVATAGKNGKSHKSGSRGDEHRHETVYVAGGDVVQAQQVQITVGDGGAGEDAGGGDAGGGDGGGGDGGGGDGGGGGGGCGGGGCGG